MSGPDRTVGIPSVKQRGRSDPCDPPMEFCRAVSINGWLGQISIAMPQIYVPWATMAGPEVKLSQTRDHADVNVDEFP